MFISYISIERYTTEVANCFPALIYFAPIKNAFSVSSKLYTGTDFFKNQSFQLGILKKKKVEVVTVVILLEITEKKK